MTKYILIEERFVDGLVNQLKLRLTGLSEQGVTGNQVHPPRSYIFLLENAPTIEIPNVYLFKDSDGDTWHIVAWSEEQARAYLESQPYIASPLTFVGSSPAYPGYSPIRIVNL